ncbi:hypothetical protein [Aureimonas sp. AU20]|uniref:hypothetical protein n=1 Tax=Aureimonas sp. AU20 TaxID=1349819 RepID=UPI000B2270A0|nr:hypothetical protein [Aureimonas sp. AU20]
MTKTGCRMARRLRAGPALAIALLAGLASALVAHAQESAPPVPTADPAAPPETTPPTGGDIIAWYPAPSRCAYFTPEDAARFQPDRPETWRFRFLILAATPKPGESTAQAARGYVMKDGLLRELETVRSGPDADGASVTVWRSVGEPRLNITTTLKVDGEEHGAPRQRGTLATIRGDGREVSEITGTCAP